MNVKQAVPFFWVSSIDTSLRFYLDGLGFTQKLKWIDEGKVRWCWLELGGAALMLQELRVVPQEKRGAGVSICFICEDALAIYRETTARGLAPKRPFVGNAMWVTNITDPDGYELSFESSTDAEEESEFEG